MKKIITTLASVFIAVIVMAQVSESINYQAVARNNSGQALANQTIKVRFTISRNAVTQYSETRQVTTNALGLFNVQIGSAGAISTTGTFNAIDWTNNTPNMFLKVELDINNSGVFTDMGAQSFSSVPFALASKKAFEAENTLQIAGRPIDQTTTPTAGSRLSWDGTNWTPVKKDTVYNVNSVITNAAILNSSNWQFIHLPSNQPIITLDGNERVIANMVGVMYNDDQTSTLSVQFAICYQNTIAGSSIVPFSPGAPNRITLPPLTNGSLNLVSLTSGAAVTLPQGTYRIGLAIKNSSSSLPVFPATGSNISGTIEIRH